MVGQVDSAVMTAVNKSQRFYAACAAAADGCTARLPTERTDYCKDAEELRAVMLEIGSLQNREIDDIVGPAGACFEGNGVTEKKSLWEMQRIGKKKLKEIVFPLFSTRGRAVWSCICDVSVHVRSCDP